MKHGWLDTCHHTDNAEVLIIPCRCCSRTRDSSYQSSFFLSSVVQFWWACSSCSLSLLWDEWHPVLFSTALGHLLQDFQRYSFEYVGCSPWLFELQLPSWHLKAVWPFSSDPWHQQRIFTQRPFAHWIFPVFLCKFQQISIFSNTHGTFKVT